jgi:hypothetical protein
MGKAIKKDHDSTLTLPRKNAILLDHSDSVFHCKIRNVKCQVVNFQCGLCMLFRLEFLLVLSIYHLLAEGSVLIMRLNAFRVCKCLSLSAERTVAQT